MAALNRLRRRLGLNPLPGEPRFSTLPEAAAGLMTGLMTGPDAGPDDRLPVRWRPEALTLLARSGDAAGLLLALLEALDASEPEAALVSDLAQISGGRAELLAGWGDRVAGQGEPGGPLQEVPLRHGPRQLGTLRLWAAPEWTTLLGVAAQVARLARLQSAALGTTRRRQGERVFEALLAAESAELAPSGPCAVAALSLDAAPPRSPRAHEARSAALDVLCGAGEAQFRQRGVACLSLVRGDRALWLWPTQDLPGETAVLHASLQAATPVGFRLGVSAPQPGAAQVPLARLQAEQARQALPESRGVRSYTTLDPLRSLVSEGDRQRLRGQLMARLAPQDPQGRLAATLRDYLTSGGDVGALAARYGVHANTVRYRLTRTEALLELTLNDPASLTRLYLAFGLDGDAGGADGTAPGMPD